MVPGFGKQTLIVGSHPQCDVVLTAAGVAPEHGKIINQGGGKLMYMSSGAGRTTVGGREMGAGEAAPFDFRQQFKVGEAVLPFDHPAITLSLMTVGQEAAQPGRLILGRDPSRSSLVVGHPSVSSLHCTVSLDRMMITDHDSTSGTYVAGQKIPGGQPTELPATGSIFIGPVPVQIALLIQLGQTIRDSGQSRELPRMSQPLQRMSQPMSQLPAQGQPLPGQNQPTAAAQMPELQAMAQALMSQQQGAAPDAASTSFRKHKTVFGQLDFGAGGTPVRTIGRTPDNDICVSHPQVSSRHAQVEQIGGKLYVTDRSSANGTYVNGQRIPPGQRIEIGSGQKIYVGPMPLQLQMGASGAVEVVNEEFSEERWAGRPLYEIEAWQLYLEVPDRDNKDTMRVLLDNIAFKALPGDMIALMGPSGAGKTTLLLTLNGYMPPTEGLVRINGEDLYSIYDLLRGSIGYVPQDDLVHAELTVFEAVKYSAKFRLPPDFSDDEISARVHQTLRDLGLDSVAHLQIGAPEKKILSGGQRKRVNIALELVTDPVILYLDEPTSGLASDDAASLIQLLSELSKATGKTIIMTIHQPAKEEYEKFTHALVLGYGGVPMYFGPTVPESYEFFSGYKLRIEGKYVQPPSEQVVDNPRDMFANITEREGPIFQQLQQQNPYAHRSQARQAAAVIWRHEYYSETNPIYKRMYSGRRSVGTGEGQRGIPATRPTTSGQFRLLLARYFLTKVRDVGGTLIMLAQAPIIGILLAIVFGGQDATTPAWCLGALQDIAKRTNEKVPADLFGKLTTTQDHTGAVFFLVVSAVWFGTSNAAREIVRERAIYLRERMVNLGLFNYVMSKFVLLSLFCIVQCALLLGIVFVALGFHGGANAFLQELSALVTTSITSVALGLLLSTLVQSSEAAMALTPIALIPQVVLGGLMVPATTIGKLATIMYGIPARWGFEAAVVPERIATLDDAAWVIDLAAPDKSSAADFIFHGKFQCATAQLASDSLNGAWAFTSYETSFIPYAILGSMTLVILVFIMALLKRRDRV